MTIELNKNDLISLVKGVSPSYAAMQHHTISPLGSYTGGFHDKWYWHTYKLEELTEEQLYNLYKFLKSH
jgi:hypothetical protein